MEDAPLHTLDPHCCLFHLLVTSHLHSKHLINAPKLPSCHKQPLCCCQPCNVPMEATQGGRVAAGHVLRRGDRLGAGAPVLLFPVVFQQGGCRGQLAAAGLEQPGLF